MRVHNERIDRNNFVKLYRAIYRRLAGIHTPRPSGTIIIFYKHEQTMFLLTLKKN